MPRGMPGPNTSPKDLILLGKFLGLGYQRVINRFDVDGPQHAYRVGGKERPRPGLSKRLGRCAGRQKKARSKNSSGWAYYRQKPDRNRILVNKLSCFVKLPRYFIACFHWYFPKT
jgi:hypothetical protein